MAAEKWEYTMYQEPYGLLSKSQEALWRDCSEHIRDLGLLGWELVNVVANDYGVGFYFKRRIQPKEEINPWPTPR